MAKIKIKNNDMAMFLVCEAIGAEREEFIDIMPDEDGAYDLKITLNGKEINVERFLTSLKRSYDHTVTKHATDLLRKEYEKMIDSIYDIQEALKYHCKIFEKKVYE